MSVFFAGDLSDARGASTASDKTWADALSGGQLCLFCLTSDWRWFRHLGAAAPDADAVLPQFVVTCDKCDELLTADNRVELSARIEAVNPGESEELMRFLEFVTSSIPRPRHSASSA